MSHTTPQPTPTPGERSVTRAVIADLEGREAQGIAKYGRTLETFNGRVALVDAYQEALDQVQYLKQELLERETLVSDLFILRKLLVDHRPAYTLVEGILGRLLVRTDPQATTRCACQDGGQRCYRIIPAGERLCTPCTPPAYHGPGGRHSYDAPGLEGDA